MPSWTSRVARAPVNFAIKTMYAVYLRSFSGTQDAHVIPERIVEYPFALRHLSRLPADSQIVVVGCYGDLLTTLLPAAGHRVVGIDIKEFPLEYPNFKFLESDLRKINLPDRSFDGAAAISTIEHVGLFDGDSDGDRTAVTELRRLLKPGGTFILTVPFAATATVIEMNQRIYDQHTLTALLDGFRIDELKAYEYTPEKAWSEIPVKDASPHDRWHETHGTAVAAAVSTLAGPA